ncbi:MAG: amino acid adenylation domain-containing protein, partial [Micromonosporaceae bacterium]|nr:amino acid adenylation domain-containing protein [Micromonosporaceae bacterium]
PLLRAGLCRLGAGDHVLLLTAHHAVSDGWSTGILVDELLACYDSADPPADPSATLPADPLPPPVVQYGDYAAWQRDQRSAGEWEPARAYWRQRLAGVPPLELPTDQPRGAEQTFAGGSYDFRLDQRLTERLERFGRGRRATLYMVLLAAYQVLLSRHSGQRDFAVGSPVAGRPLPELERLIGLFVNLLPMRADLAGEPSFGELVDRTRGAALDAWAHQALPFEHLVRELDIERDPSRAPVFQAVFALQNYLAAGPREADGPRVASGPGAAGGLRVAPFPFGLTATRYDLEWYASPAPDGIECTFVYHRDLFTPQRIGWLSGHLIALLESAVTDPDLPVSALPMLTAEELAEAAARNHTAADLGEPTCLHRLVLDQAARTPDALAVRDARGELRYGELEAQARRLAGRLTESGVAPGELVAVVMERGAEQVTATLAIQLAGAAYLPVDPDLPPERRRHLLERGECRVALTQPWLADRLAWPSEVTVFTGAGDADPYAGPGPATPDDLGYVIFTSGSTGDPKGVMIDHAAAGNTVRDINQRFGVGPSDRVLAISALSFDLSVYDVFGTLAAGGTLVMPEPAASKDPAAWARWVREQRVTVWDSVPALMELLVEQAEADGTDLSSLRLVLLSGDWIPLDLPDRIRALAPDAQVISLGGATEGSIWSIWHSIGEVDPAWRSIPYGTPLANQSFRILDQHRRPVPVGVTGELHIGGAGVARGYWRDPERTAASFVSHPGTGERLYRTGDLGRYRPDGVIEFLGRVDAQVKIRGYRIELGEIEAHLARRPDVAEAVVAVRRDHSGQQLVGYVVPAASTAPPAHELRTFLHQSLPGYMVPSRYVSLPRLPLSANGKVDRDQLPAPPPGADAGAGPGADPESPTTAAEKAVVEVWRQILGVDAVGLDSDFFDLGGHSLAAIQAVTRLRRTLPEAAVGVTDLFRHPTPRELATLIDRPTAAGSRRLLHRLTPPVPGRTPTLSCVCVPYGGGQPLAYRPLADALPEDWTLYAVAIPGHDPGVPEEAVPAVEEVAERCAAEVLETVTGPLVVYGHCGVGGALAVELARRLEAAGREVQAVYLGAVFPFARPRGRLAGALARLVRHDRLGGVRAYQNRLTAMGADVAGLEPDQVRFMVHSLRRDTHHAEEYFTRLLDAQAAPLRAPVISVVGERDPATDFYRERYREWQFLTSATGLVILDEAGHYFLTYRAADLAEVLTRTRPEVASGQPRALSRQARGPDARWWLEEVSSGATGGQPPDASTPDPSFWRFLVVALSQLVTFVGTAVTDFALPVWIYTTTGSLGQFALFMMLAIVPGILAAPLLGTLVDRSSRRTMMIAGSAAGGLTQVVLGVLVWTGSLQIWHTYPLVVCLSVALTMHRLAYVSAVPQLVPKRYLGHANGVVQLAGGVAQFVAPLAAVALLATVGLEGILIFDVVSFGVAIGAVLLLRFPATLAYVPRESLATEIAEGFRQSLGHPGLRAMVGYFALLNLLLSPLLMSLLPLSLSFGTLTTAGTVAFVGGIGAALGGLAMVAWGGPARQRMRGMLLASLLFGGFAVVTGLQPSLVAVGVGAFGLWATLSLVNGVYLTIIHVKVPQRYHGRVIALNQAVAWSTLPLGFAVVAPLAERLLEPLLAADGVLAPTVGAVIGTGPGRGLGLMYLLFGVAITGLALAAMRHRTLARFDEEVPDAVPDDLVGAQALRDRAPAEHDLPRP